MLDVPVNVDAVEVGADNVVEGEVEGIEVDRENEIESEVEKVDVEDGDGDGEVTDDTRSSGTSNLEGENYSRLRRYICQRTYMI